MGILANDVADYLQAATWNYLTKPKIIKYIPNIIKAFPMLTVISPTTNKINKSNDGQLGIYEGFVELNLTVANSDDATEGIKDIEELMEGYCGNNRNCIMDSMDDNPERTGTKNYKLKFIYKITLLKLLGTW